MNVNRELRKLAAAQYGIVGRRQAHSLGVTSKELLHRIRRGDFQELSPEVLRLAGTTDSDGARLAAGVLDAPLGAVLSHRSAAAWWGVPGFSVDHPAQVTVPRQGIRTRTRLAAVHYHKDFPLDQIMVVQRIPTSSPALTMFQLAAQEHPARVERAVDSGFAMGLFDGRVLNDLLDRVAARGRNGIRTMRAVLQERGPDYVPPESGNESRFEWILKTNGVPLPRRQVSLGGEFQIGRVDYFYEAEHGVVEILSRRYHSSRLDSQADRARFRRLEEEGFNVLTIWDHEIWERPDDVASKVWKFLSELRRPARDRFPSFSRDIPTL